MPVLGTTVVGATTSTRSLTEAISQIERRGRVSPSANVDRLFQRIEPLERRDESVGAAVRPVKAKRAVRL